MEKPVEPGNVIAIRTYEPALRMTGVVIETNDDWATCVMLTTRFNRRTHNYEFQRVEAAYALDLKEQKFEVLSLPSKEVLA